LQFEVVANRLQTEYDVAVAIDPAVYTSARWLGEPALQVPPLGGQGIVATDRHGRAVLLFDSTWALQYFARHHPDVPLLEESPAVLRA
ncbi:MAG: peptide chain release factor 3, partial [Vicinamibacterales bacterium]